MRLITRNSDLSSADPVVPVRWCIDRAESESLKEREAKNIHIFFVIAYEGTDLEDRLLVPIDQMMAYLTFRRPGKQRVFAKVVWAENVNTLKECFLSHRRRGRYQYNYLNHDHTALHDDYFDYFDYCHLRGGAKLEVIVPKEHFPKEPPAWLKRLVNMGYSYPPVDQCQFRQRLLMTPLKFILLAPLIMAVRTIAAIILNLVLGLRIGFKGLFHPWRNSVEDIFGAVSPHNSWVLHKERNEPRSRWFILCHPLPFLLFFLVTAIVKHHYHVSYLMALMIVGHALVIAAKALFHFFSKIWHIIFGTFLGAGLGFLIFWSVKKAHARKQERERSIEFRRKRDQEKLEAYDALYSLLGCTTIPMVPALSALPPERRTLILRYQDLKAKVCRPFATS